MEDAVLARWAECPFSIHLYKGEISMGKAIRAFGPVVVLIVFAAVILILQVANQSHADAKHVEAPAIRTTYRNDACDGSELWFSPARGTVLILCGMPNSNQWGGIIIRFIS